MVGAGCSLLSAFPLAPGLPDDEGRLTVADLALSSGLAPDVLAADVLGLPCPAAAALFIAPFLRTTAATVAVAAAAAALLRLLVSISSLNSLKSSLPSCCYK